VADYIRKISNLKKDVDKLRCHVTGACIVLFRKGGSDGLGRVWLHDSGYSTNHNQFHEL